MKNNESLMVIDPAVVTPSLESFNRIVKVAPFSVTYHLPALYGTKSMHKEFNENTLGIIILGSATSVNDKNKWQDEIEKVILQATEINIPIMGLCYGHQLIGKIFGGIIEPLWNEKIERGNRKVNIKKSSLWGSSKSGLLLYSHQDGITTPPPKFNVIASSEMVDIEGIESIEKPIWGFQAHLEATEAFVEEHNLGLEEANESFNFGHMLLDTFILSLK
jgi:GMP synthase-like glutamine amidotransferase